MQTKRASILSRAKHTMKRVLAACSLAAGSLALAACGMGADDNAEPNPLLYEIANKDGEVEGWMLGTIHALPDGVDWRTPAIDKVVDEADFLIVEIADLEDEAMIARAFSELYSSPGLPPISQRVPPSKRKALLDLIDEAGLHPSHFRRIETWAVALTLSNAVSGGGAENGVDRAIIKDFAGREVLEFEGAVRQLMIFDGLAEEDQRVMLNSVIDEADDAEAAVDELLQSWLTGDEDALAEATQTGALTDPELRAAILVNRNRTWDRRLVGLLRGEEKPLVAVGAAHLVGKNSLNELLEARGYTIKRLP